MPEQPTNARLLFIKQAISTTAWPELCVMLLDAMQEQQNQIDQLVQICMRLSDENIKIKKQNRQIAVEMRLVERGSGDI